MDAFSYMSWDSLLPFLLACIVIEITPGPNMAFLTLVSATKGRAFGFATVLGVTLGLLIIGFAAAAGLATTISNSPFLYQALKIAGIIYLLSIAFKEWRNASREEGAVDGPVEGKLSYFQHGFVVNILNPKAGVFYIAILPSFIDPSGEILTQAITLTIISIVIATIVHVLIVSLAGLLRPILDNPKHQRNIRRTLSLLLAMIALWFGLSR